MPPLVSFSRTIRQLAAIGRRFYARNWVLGTSGNFSALIGRRPVRLAMTASAAHKGTLSPADFVRVDARAGLVGRSARRPSAESLLHVEIVARRGAGAVLHTHSVWSTILSDRHAQAGGLVLEGFEMLKGLEGVSSHAHREWVPILENDQDMTRLAAAVGRTLEAHPAAHAFLLRRHGLYTWGSTVAEAERHVEILEFLLEAIGRESARRPRWPSSEFPKKIARSPTRPR
jgi:methylthioribulose-1-phosphate dehydratase